MSKASPRTTSPQRRRLRDDSAKRGPGRPSAAQVESINRNILNAARKLFLNDGYAATPMETIAAAAGISKGTLYARYSTKDALLWALIDRDSSFWSTEELVAKAPAASNLRERLQFRARKVAEFYCSDKFAHCEQLVSSSVSARDELARMHFKMAYQQAVKEIAQDVFDGSDEPIDSQRAIEVADLLMGMLYGWARAKGTFKRVAQKDAFAYADLAVDVFLNGRSGWKR